LRWKKPALVGGEVLYFGSNGAEIWEDAGFDLLSTESLDIDWSRESNLIA